MHPITLYGVLWTDCSWFAICCMMVTALRKSRLIPNVRSSIVNTARMDDHGYGIIAKLFHVPDSPGYVRAQMGPRGIRNGSKTEA